MKRHAAVARPPSAAAFDVDLGAGRKGTASAVPVAALVLCISPFRGGTIYFLFR